MLILWVLSALLLIIFSGTLSLRLAYGPRDVFWIAFAVGVLQLGFIACLCSLLGQLNPSTWLLIQSILTVACLGVFGGPWRRWVPGQAAVGTILAYVRSWPTLGTLVGLVSVGFFVILSALSRYRVPILWDDDQSYHASRVLYWIQQESLFPYPTHNLRQVVFPFGGELFFLWGVLLTRREEVSRMVFWLGYPLAVLGIYVLLRELGTSRVASLLGGALYMMTPLVQWASVTLMPEPWLAVCLTGLGYWWARFFQSESGRLAGQSLLWVGVFIALSAHMKMTALAVMPGVLVLGLWAWGRLGGRGWIFMAAGVLGGYLFSGLWVPTGFNWIYYGHPLGPQAFRRFHQSDLTFRQMYTHAVRLPFVLLEFPTVPLPAQALLQRLGDRITASLGADRPLFGEDPTRRSPNYWSFTIPEKASRFSLGGVLWLPALAAGICRWWRKVRPHMDPWSALIVIDLSLIGGIVLGLRWIVWASVPERHLIAPYALGIAFTIALADQYLSRHRLLRGLGILLLMWTAYSSFQTWPSIARAMTLRLDLPSVQPWILTEVLPYLPADGTVLLVGSQDTFDYPLFEPSRGYSRRVVLWGQRVWNPHEMTRLIRSRRVTHVIIHEVGYDPTTHWEVPIDVRPIVDWLRRQELVREVRLNSPYLYLFEIGDEIMRQRLLTPAGS
jgi:hypothetical protein